MQNLGLHPAPTEQGPWGWGPPVLQLSGMFLLKDRPSPPRPAPPDKRLLLGEGPVLSAAAPACGCFPGSGGGLGHRPGRL